MDQRDLLAQFMLAAARGQNPMGGPQQFENDIPGMPPPQPQLPPGWMPPGTQQPQAAPPIGDFMPTPPPAYAMPAPRFHRLNPPPSGQNWRDIQV